ncbi:hypothetical protein D9756_010188 [Leucocoprinus leucothites]|uniref:Uncharacterized protein n=1 Tax=Leucocoprinus leucothites TaxID=201217 RepID=A0A8H5FT98_9AGAR|nr:hypothetical protein D9756_010188 [Leucoagaricus leucothites]
MAVASASAANVAAKAAAPPSSSAFSELLRRSRFASYDPAIAQTYTAPQAHARRGHYGLKRPIPMPYKDSYITVNQFEHHAQFTEWNNAEALVKFVKRVEELNITPRNAPNGEWDKNLGEAKTQWLVDSEFAESDYGSRTREPVDGLGRRGEGAYGARRPPPQQADTTSPAFGNPSQLNIASLSPRQFKRYLNKLRDLSPEYQQYLIEEHKARYAKRKAEALAEASEFFSSSEESPQIPEFKEEEDLLFVAGQAKNHRLHRPFLADHFSSTSPSSPTKPKRSGKVNTPTTAISANIERQPHRTGALTYTHYSPLETVLTTRPQPGYILQVAPQFSSFFAYIDKKNDRNSANYVSLFAGIVSNTTRTNAGTNVPFYNPEATDMAVGHGPGEGVNEKDDSSFSASALPPPPADPTDPLKIKPSTATMRLLSLTLRSPPSNTTTGYKAHLSLPSDHLRAISVTAESATDMDLEKRNVGSNPYKPGSIDYSTHAEFDAKNRFGKVGALMAGEGGDMMRYGGVGKGAGAGGIASYYDLPRKGVMEGVLERGARFGSGYSRGNREMWDKVFRRNDSKVGNGGGRGSGAGGEDVKRTLQGIVGGAGAGAPVGEGEGGKEGV